MNNYPESYSEKALSNKIREETSTRIIFESRDEEETTSIRVCEESISGRMFQRSLVSSLL